MCERFVHGVNASTRFRTVRRFVCAHKATTTSRQEIKIDEFVNGTMKLKARVTSACVFGLKLRTEQRASLLAAKGITISKKLRTEQRASLRSGSSVLHQVRPLSEKTEKVKEKGRRKRMSTHFHHLMCLLCSPDPPAPFQFQVSGKKDTMDLKCDCQKWNPTAGTENGWTCCIPEEFDPSVLLGQMFWWLGFVIQNRVP